MAKTKTTTVVYDGPHVAVEIAATGQVVTRGVPVEVPAEVAAALLEQEPWSEPKKSKSKPETKES